MDNEKDDASYVCVKDSLIKWQTACLAKEYKDLGILDLRHMNITCKMVVKISRPIIYQSLKIHHSVQIL